LADETAASGKTDPRRIQLHAGPLTMELQPDLGFLRYLRFGSREVLRGVYAALRDHNWRTVPPDLRNLAVDQAEDGFCVTFIAECKDSDIDFIWNGIITGCSDGTVTYKMDGRARTTFRRNRIGFCVLHPIGPCAGRPCTVEATDGTLRQGVFSRYISPQQPFKDIKSVSHEVLPGVTAKVDFEGEVFEMEDQRNWTDASLKTYGTPLELPFPVEIRQGTAVRQAVTLSLHGDVSAGALRVSVPRADAAIRVRCGSAVRLPRLGLGVASQAGRLSAREIDRLAQVRPDHLRVDLELTGADYTRPAVGGVCGCRTRPPRGATSKCPTDGRLRRASWEAEALGTSLHVALMLGATPEDELRRLARLLGEIRPPVAVWLIFHQQEMVTSAKWVELARSVLHPPCPDALFAVGTNANFAELNRGRPAEGVADLICYSINPQVHVSDDDSLVESLEAQQQTVETARQFAGDRPIMVSPVTLKPRFNPVATGPQPPVPPGELPPQVDPRQPTLFAAGWTLGSIAALAKGGAYSVTYYETIGWRGIMETEAGTLLPEKFPSAAGCVFPVYHVLADLGQSAGSHVLPLEAADPLKIQGLAVGSERAETLWVANMTEQPQTVILPGGPSKDMIRFRVRLLDQASLAEATSAPERFRAQEGSPLEGARLELPPHAMARIERVEKDTA
jgi:hypothetical protein